MEIIYILLGAFLAVLTPILTNRISIIYQRKEIKKENKTASSITDANEAIA